MMEQFKTEALLSGIERLRAENARMKEELAQLKCDEHEQAAIRASLKRELQSFRPQQSEPVAWIGQGNGWKTLSFFKDSESYQPLYLSPPAQSESERDAARYRWLRDRLFLDGDSEETFLDISHVWQFGTFSKVDSFVDAAMQEGKK